VDCKSKKKKKKSLQLGIYGEVMYLKALSCMLCAYFSD